MNAAIKKMEALQENVEDVTAAIVALADNEIERLEQRISEQDELILGLKDKLGRKS